MRVALAALLCLALLGTGTALAIVAGPAPLHALPPLLVGGLLVAAYTTAMLFALDFEVRGDSHSITVGQLPLALGVLVAPASVHLAACLTATVLVLAIRRSSGLKALYNLGAAGFEVGVAAAAVGAAHAAARPTPLLWAALFAGLLVADNVGSLSLNAVWALLGMPVDRGQVFRPLALGAATSAAATAIALITVSAAYTEPGSVVVVLALAGALVLAYRRHRLLAAQQQRTQDLYAFVRDLRPVDAEQDGVCDVLEQVRLLLHAERLELLVPRRDGSWQEVVAQEGRTPLVVPAQPPRSTATSDDGVMTSTLFGDTGVLGVLTARGRLGNVRTFDLGDVRLLETVGTELRTALERGRLLTDLRRTATTDPVTQLPNLVETTRLLDALLASSPGPIAVAAASIDTFRDVNETLGHDVGDDLLVETARRLRQAYPTALIGRTGGARFVVAESAGDTDDAAVMLGLGLRATVEGEARLGPVTTHLRLSVGVTRSPEHGRDAQTLLRRAETAMSSARAVNGGPVSWAPAYEVQGQRRLAVLTALRDAVSTGAIGLVFQPKVDARTGAATGVEALARWTDPALGTVSPDEFIPLAEASGFIGPLTSTVLRQATTAARGWQRRAPGVGVAVNVSADTVLDPQFVTEVAAALTASGLAPELLTLELTEGVVVSDPALAVERLGELRERGVRIAIDDFGTGYSSLAYLKGLPIDEVKIDKIFVDSVAVSAADAAMVRGVVDIAHTLGLRVVAEGVEDSAQSAMLQRLGVDELQGYLHGRPMAGTAVASWLRGLPANRVPRQASGVGGGAS